MKTKTFIISILLLCTITLLFYGFISKQTATSQFMIVTVLETSTAFDGKMIVTAPDGTSTTTDLKNYYGGFVATKSVSANDKIILDELNQLHNQGWEIDKTVSSMVGLSVTRFILKKSREW